MTREGRVAVLLVLVLGTLATMAGSASAAGWLPPVNASVAVPSPTKYDVMSVQDVAVDEQGNAVSVWVQADIDGPEILEAATRPAGGAWSESVPISDPSESALAPKVVVNADGAAAAVWVGYKALDGVVRAATRLPGGQWSEPVPLSGIERDAAEPDIAIDDEGNVTAIWSESDGNWEEALIEAVTRPAGGDWSEPVELSSSSRVAVSPQLAVDPEGEVTAVWTLNTPNREDGVVQSKTLPAGGEWSSESVDISGEDGLASWPRIAIDGQGDATAVWQQQDIPAASGFRRFVQTAHRVDGTWDDPLSITREDWLTGNPELTVDRQGNATAIWLTGEPGTATRHLQTRSRNAEGSWGEPFNLVTKAGLLEPHEGDMQLAADAQGNVTAIWTAWSAPMVVVRSARLGAGSGWSTPVDVSAASANSLLPQLAVDPQGHATVVWSGHQGTTHAVRSRVFDPVAPELGDLEIPATGVVGQPVGMSVDPFDVWSPVTTTWEFGDGGSAAGAPVSHCYSSPGERTVTVTGTDAAANATSASQTITIEADPALAGGVNPCAGPEPPNPPGPPADPPKPPSSSPDLGPAAPVVSGLSQSRSRWRTPGVRRGSRLPVGTTFRFQLDRPASVRLTFIRVAPGRGDQARGVVEMVGKAGANAYNFRGKIRGRILKQGRYRLLLSALADGRASAVATIEFTIVR